MTRSLTQSEGSIPVDRGGRLDRTFVLYLDGPLREPLDDELRRGVRGLLGRGARTIVVDLARVPAIDAAGLGEIVRAYTLTAAPGGALQIVHAAPWVQEMLERAGLYEILTGP
jgi:anti-anti-sigma factor